ncbi:MAG: dihydroorotase [Treponemataceae bacterium]|nr:dihydroorotase [Treponemataceae bacterium]
MKRIFYNAHLVDENMDCDGAVLVQDGKIHSIVQGDFSDPDQARDLVKLFGKSEDCSSGKCSSCGSPCPEEASLEFVNCRQKTLMPSFIDMHVHFRYPGQTQKEDLDTGSKAAVAGGFGCLVLMPNTNPVVSSSTLSHQIEEESARFERIKVIQSVSLTKDFDGKTTSHIDDLEEVPIMTEDGHDVQNSNVMLDAMSKAAIKGAIVSCHCEDEAFTNQAKELRKSALAHYAEYDRTKSELEKTQAQSDMEEANNLLAMAEDLATQRNIDIARQAGCRVHLAHVSTKNSIEAVRRGKKIDGQKVTCEVTPHHFGLSTENSENLRYIVNPPIRSEEDRQALLQAFQDGTVDVISTDHAPHTMQDKENGAPGFPGLETAFAVACTSLYHTNIVGIRKLSQLMSANPARILALDKENKDQLVLGHLKAGFTANLVLVDTEEEWTVDSSKFMTKGKMCPFEGMELKGKVLSTWFKGNKVF